jgi:hypothetical protein
VPLCAGTALLLAATRPSIGRGRGRVLDWSLLACLLVVAAQLVPIPPAARDRLSPHGYAIDRVVALGPEPAARPPHPLSVDPESTGWALALGAAYVGLFWCARSIFSGGGVRSTIRGVASLGLALTVVVAVQRATAPKLLYGYWPPMSTGATPYGPFVNRNNLATWLAMAVPLVVGYAMARYYSRRRGDGGVLPDAAIDPTQIWLGGAAIFMTGCLLASLSRAGILGAAVGLVAFAVFSRRRMSASGGAAWIVGALTAMVVVASAYSSLGRLAMRLNETTEQGTWGRPAIWRDTWRMTSDFRLTGVGAGAYQHAMLMYQQGSRLFFFNHAHDEYFQLAAEGGLLLVVPALIALAAAIGLMANHLRNDRTAIVWVRAGAVCGLIAAATQGVWDTGLRAPANGALFAVLAAIAMHDPKPPAAHSSHRSRSHEHHA